VRRVNPFRQKARFLSAIRSFVAGEGRVSQAETLIVPSGRVLKIDEVEVLSNDFKLALKLGEADLMGQLNAEYERRAATDPGIKSVDKRLFRDYYALRASVAFSLGSHDEWNIVRSINDTRRHADARHRTRRVLGGVKCDGASSSRFSEAWLRNRRRPSEIRHQHSWKDSQDRTYNPLGPSCPPYGLLLRKHCLIAAT